MLDDGLILDVNIVVTCYLVEFNNLLLIKSKAREFSFGNVLPQIKELITNHILDALDERGILNENVDHTKYSTRLWLQRCK